MPILNSTVEECTLKLQRIERDPVMQYETCCGNHQSIFSIMHWYLLFSYQLTADPYAVLIIISDLKFNCQ